jgi:hypothetical protein
VALSESHALGLVIEDRIAETVPSEARHEEVVWKRRERKRGKEREGDRVIEKPRCLASCIV